MRLTGTLNHGSLFTPSYFFFFAFRLKARLCVLQRFFTQTLNTCWSWVYTAQVSTLYNNPQPTCDTPLPPNTHTHTRRSRRLARPAVDLPRRSTRPPPGPPLPRCVGSSWIKTPGRLCCSGRPVWDTRWVAKNDCPAPLLGAGVIAAINEEEKHRTVIDAVWIFHS